MVVCNLRTKIKNFPESLKGKMKMTIEEKISSIPDSADKETLVQRLHAHTGISNGSLEILPGESLREYFGKSAKITPAKIYTERAESAGLAALGLLPLLAGLPGLIVSAPIWFCAWKMANKADATFKAREELASEIMGDLQTRVGKPQTLAL
jgi:hypothetical protein